MLRRIFFFLPLVALLVGGLLAAPSSPRYRSHARLLRKPTHGHHRAGADRRAAAPQPPCPSLGTRGAAASSDLQGDHHHYHHYHSRKASVPAIARASYEHRRSRSPETKPPASRREGASGDSVPAQESLLDKMRRLVGFLPGAAEDGGRGAEEETERRHAGRGNTHDVRRLRGKRAKVHLYGHKHDYKEGGDRSAHRHAPQRGTHALVRWRRERGD